MPLRRDFEVQFRPRLKRSLPQLPDFDWDRLDDSSIKAALPKNYELFFSVAREKFGYHPSSITTVLGDVVGAAEHVRRGSSGELTVGGYPVLGAEVKSDVVRFTYIGSGGVVAQAPRVEVQEELDSAVATVCNFIRRNVAAPLLAADHPLVRLRREHR
jgi:hypothetical protein